MQPRVTVIIPAYKASATIGRAVDSVLAQPNAAAEVIVVVDGPDSATERALAHYKERLSVLIQPLNKGVQAARNRGLAEAQGEYLLFLDADDYLEGDLLSAGARQMADEQADLGLAAMLVRQEDAGGERRVRLSGDAAALFEGWLAEGRFVAPCSVLWRASYLRRIGGWDEALHRQEDGEMVMRALLLGGRAAHLSGGHGVYVQHKAPDRLTAKNDNLGSLLDVPAKLLALPGKILPEPLVRRAAAHSYANAARSCLLRGRQDLAAEAMSRAQALGGARPTVGPPFGRLYSFLPLTAAVHFERTARALLRKPY